MRGFTISLLVLVAVGFLTINVASAAPVAAPHFIKTHYWKYNISGSLAAPIPGGPALTLNIDGGRTTWVTAVGAGTATLVDYSSVTMSGSYIDPTYGPVIVVVREEANVTHTIRGAAAGMVDTQMSFYVNISISAGGVPLPLGALAGGGQSTLSENTWNFPLEEQSRGRTTSQVTFHFQWTFLGTPSPPVEGSAALITEYLAGTTQEVTVPAGTFSALAVDSWNNATSGSNPEVGSTPYAVGLGNRSREYYSEAVGGAVKREYYNGTGAKIGEEVLAAYNYASPLTATVGADVLTGRSPLVVRLNATPEGGTPPYTYAWNLGEGNTSNLRNPVHTYNQARTYTVTLVVTDTAGQRVEKGLQITVEPPPAAVGSPLLNNLLLLGGALGAIAAVAIALGVALRRRRGPPATVAPSPPVPSDLQEALPSPPQQPTLPPPPEERPPS